MCACASQMAKRHEKKRGGLQRRRRRWRTRAGGAIYEREQHACAGYTTTRGRACAAQGAHDAATSPARSLLLETHTPCYQPLERRN